MIHIAQSSCSCSSSSPPEASAAHRRLAIPFHSLSDVLPSCSDNALNRGSQALPLGAGQAYPGLHREVGGKRHFFFSASSPDSPALWAFFFGIVTAPGGEIEMPAPFVDVVGNPPGNRLYVGIPGVFCFVNGNRSKRLLSSLPSGGFHQRHKFLPCSIGGLVLSIQKLDNY